MRLIILISIFVFVSIGYCSEEVENNREKRSYYGGYDIDDYWYAGRIIGIIFGIILLLACCCLPCVCLIGIWFLGWFGLRQRRMRRDGQEIKDWPQNQPTTVYSTPPRVRNVVVEPIPDSNDPRRYPLSAKERDNIIYQAEDRYYTSSTQPVDGNTMFVAVFVLALALSVSARSSESSGSSESKEKTPAPATCPQGMKMTPASGTTCSNGGSYMNGVCCTPIGRTNPTKTTGTVTSTTTAGLLMDPARPDPHFSSLSQSGKRPILEVNDGHGTSPFTEQTVTFGLVCNGDGSWAPAQGKFFFFFNLNFKIYI
ncbi:hypothetical protein WR25_04256 isoform B [Diploscapter pachys]|uniref:Uncharacterized protein n=1 Tax=Diploscapter pachys TaxID=2018661 RepID=A0A2A2K1I7_9BILA|nr:hypothetical protein WR25_04256 isoform B [Diploscapter pachys]